MLQDPVPIGADRVGGSGALSLLPSVTELPLVEALRLMIALSDNDATNAVIALVGFEAVGRTCRRLGLAHTHLRRTLMNDAARAAGLDNVTCARDLAQVMASLRLGDALPQARDPGSPRAPGRAAVPGRSARSPARAGVAREQDRGDCQVSVTTWRWSSTVAAGQRLP